MAQNGRLLFAPSSPDERVGRRKADESCLRRALQQDREAPASRRGSRQATGFRLLVGLPKLFLGSL